MPSDPPVAHARVTFESAAEHVSTEVPVVAPTRRAGELRLELVGRRHESASHVIVCDGERFLGIVRIEDLLSAPASWRRASSVGSRRSSRTA